MDAPILNNLIYEPVETPAVSSSTSPSGDRGAGVWYSEKRGAFVSTCINPDTGLEEKQFFYPHKFPGDTDDVRYEAARQAALQCRRDHFLTRLWEKKDHPEQLEKVRQCVENAKLTSEAARLQNGKIGEVQKKIAPTIDMSNLDAKVNARRIASAKKLPIPVKEVSLPASPSNLSASSQVPSPNSRNGSRIVVQVTPSSVVQ